MKRRQRRLRAPYLSFSRTVIFAAVAAMAFVAAISGANAAKRVCYKDPGRGMVCQWVP